MAKLTEYGPGDTATWGPCISRQDPRHPGDPGDHDWGIYTGLDCGGTWLLQYGTHATDICPDPTCSCPLKCTDSFPSIEDFERYDTP